MQLVAVTRFVQSYECETKIKLAAQNSSSNESLYFPKDSSTKFTIQPFQQYFNDIFQETIFYYNISNKLLRVRYKLYYYE